MELSQRCDWSNVCFLILKEQRWRVWFILTLSTTARREVETALSWDRRLRLDTRKIFSVFLGSGIGIGSSGRWWSKLVQCLTPKQWKNVFSSLEVFWMWSWEMWFNGSSRGGSNVGPDDVKGLFRPWWFSNSTISKLIIIFLKIPLELFRHWRALAWLYLQLCSALGSVLVPGWAQSPEPPKSWAHHSCS